MVIRKGLLAAVMATTLMAAPVVQADQLGERVMDDTGATPYSMILDTVLGRPLMLGVTALGVGTFVISAPFTFAGGTTGEVWDEMVATPARNTFVRCLGCTPIQHERVEAERETAKAMEDAQR